MLNNEEKAADDNGDILERLHYELERVTATNARLENTIKQLRQDRGDRPDDTLAYERVARVYEGLISDHQVMSR